MASPSNTSEVSQSLKGFLDPSTVHKASPLLVNLLQTPRCIPALMEQISQSPDTNVRILAAVLLRKKITAHFKKLSKQQKASVKNILLERLMKDPERAVRRAVAQLISAVARKEVPAKRWNELLEFLVAESRSQSAANREMAILLFRALAETVGEALRPLFTKLQSIFIQGLADPAKEVKMESLRALAVIVSYLESEEEMEAFRPAMQPLMTITKQALQAQAEDIAAVALGVFDNLAELSVEFILPYCKPVLQLMLAIVGATTFDIHLREQASTFVSDLVSNHSGKVVKAGLIDPILKTALTVLDEESSIEADPVDLTPDRMGCDLLSVVVLAVPSQKYFAPLLKHAQTHVSSPSALMRKGGYLCLAILSESMAEPLLDHLEPLVQVCAKGCTDPEVSVRAAAAVALAEFCDYLSPFIFDHHKVVLPVFIQILTNASESFAVKQRAAAALEVYLEGLGEELNPFIPHLAKAVFPLLTNSDVRIVSSALGVVKALATGAEDKFITFLPHVMPQILKIMSLTEDEHLDMRARATVACGAVAVACGKGFVPHLQPAMALVMAGFELDAPGIRDAAYQFFSYLSITLKADFSKLTWQGKPFLPTLVELCCASMETLEGIQVRDDLFQNEGGAVDLGAEMSDPEDDDEDEFNSRRLNVQIHSGILDEQVAAVGCAQTMVENIGDPMLALLETVIPALSEMVNHPHWSPRRAAIDCFTSILMVVSRKYPNPDKWAAGSPTALHSKAQMMCDIIFPVYLERMVAEQNKQVVYTATEGFANCLKVFGGACIDKVKQKLLEAVQLLLNEKAPCQEDIEDGVYGDHDDEVIDSVTDLISALAQTYGANFVQPFQFLFKSLLRFYDMNRPYSDRSMAVGCVGEICHVIPTEALGPMVPHVLPLILKAMEDPSPAVRRNGAYAIGTLAHQAGAHLAPQYPQILARLIPLFNPEGITTAEYKTALQLKEIEPCCDNACSALAKMMTSQPGSVPMAKALPTFMNALPLKSDFEEAKYVYPFLGRLWSGNPQGMQPFLAQTVQICTAVFQQRVAPVEVKQLVGKLAKLLGTTYAAPVKAEVSKLGPQAVAIWQKVLSS